MITSVARYLLFSIVGVLVHLTNVPGALACGSGVRVTFIEASPDLFIVEHLEGHGRLLRSIDLDLSTSAGRAYVDTAYGPAKRNARNGVELDTITGFVEGTQKGAMTFKAFAPGHRFVFLVDLDDQAVAGDGNADVLTTNELEGGRATARFTDANGSLHTVSGTFDKNGIAHLGNRACS